MNIPMKDKKHRFTWVGFGAVAFSIAALSILLATGACSQVDGSRCDPALSHDECDDAPAVQCVTPAGGGNSYCCKVSAGAVASTINPGVLYVNGAPGGTIEDDNPNCQTMGVAGSEGQTCPLGTPCWTLTGCTGFLANGTCVPDAVDGESDAESDDSSTADGGGATPEASTSVEASTTEEASTASDASPEAASSTDATPE
jgi:hypothetical protein